MKPVVVSYYRVYEHHNWFSSENLSNHTAEISCQSYCSGWNTEYLFALFSTFFFYRTISYFLSILLVHFDIVSTTGLRLET